MGDVRYYGWSYKLYKMQNIPRSDIAAQIGGRLSAAASPGKDYHYEFFKVW